MHVTSAPPLAAAIHPHAWRNGEVCPSAQICLSPFQTGLLTGWGLFSTLRIYQGVPFAMEAHWERLCRDGQRLHVELGPELEAEMRRGFAELIARNQAREAVARVYFIRNRGGLLDTPGQRPTDILIFTRALRTWGESAQLRLQPQGRHAASPLAGTKTLTWAHNLVLVEDAAAAGFDDALLLNERGEVAECTSANIFVVKDGVLATPPLSSGALPGVSRRILLEAGPRHGLRLEERTLFPADLFAADEVFISSSTREVQPVARIAEAGDGAADHAIPRGPMAARVEAIFQREVLAYIAAHPAAAAPAAPVTA